MFAFVVASPFASFILPFHPPTHPHTKSQHLIRTAVSSSTYSMIHPPTHPPTHPHTHPPTQSKKDIRFVRLYRGKPIRIIRRYYYEIRGGGIYIRTGGTAVITG